MLKKKIPIIILYFLFTSNAYAYLDPISGSFIVQGLLALLAAIIFYIRNPKKLLQDAKKLIKKIYFKFKEIFSKKN